MKLTDPESCVVVWLQNVKVLGGHEILCRRVTSKNRVGGELKFRELLWEHALEDEFTTELHEDQAETVAAKIRGSECHRTGAQVDELEDREVRKG